MTENSYPCVYTGPAASFEQLGSLFENGIINNTIALPVKKGSGSIKRIPIADGLTIHHWDLKLHDTLHLERSAVRQDGQKAFSLFYIFTPDNFIITAAGSAGEKNASSKNIVFASHEVRLDFEIKAWQPIRILQIDISQEWLVNEYAHSGEFICPAYTAVAANNGSVLFTEMASFETFHAFSNLANHLNQEATDIFYLKTKVLSLLCDIFLLLGKQHTGLRENNVLIHEKMLAVEKILDQCLETSLPSISVIARQMALSESTLKRNFKQLYGTSIYEYYLQKKMKRARQLFSERPIPVKEVAYQLGYEKVSNFIQMFKKYYHYSPGRLKKATGMMEAIDPIA